jgi:hypothetical protein
MDTVGILAASKYVAKRVQEIEVLGTLAADPARAHVFRAIGGSVSLFGDDDTLAIYLCIEHARDLGIVDGAVLSKRLLMRMELWDDHAPAWSRGMHWSDESLAALFETYPPCDAAIRLHTRRLMDLQSRIDDARDHLRHAWNRLANTTPCTGAA